MATLNISRQNINVVFSGEGIVRDVEKYFARINTSVQEYLKQTGVEVTNLEILTTFKVEFADTKISVGKENAPLKKPRKQLICGWTLFLKRVVVYLKETDFDDGYFTIVSKMWNDMPDAEKRMWKDVAAAIRSPQTIARLNKIRIQEDDFLVESAHTTWFNV